MEIGVGLRVVRGPDWKWSNQDDGEGHCGTVVEIGKPGSHTTPDKTVVVQWDSGSRTNYRIGYQNAYDLRVLDNAPIGVRHPNIICNGCKKHGIAGMRWKCLVCQSVDLCTLCYMNDKHDVNHPFARFETNSSTGIEMQKRNSKNNVKLEARGIFVGSRVIRGYDWDWANQDGGEGKIGKVIDIRGWDNESRRSVANVMWASGSTNVYRLGHKGKVDLKYAVDSIGPYYYRNHLPVLGQHIEGTNRSLPSRTTGVSEDHSNASLFNVGDKVKVIIDDVNELKLFQEGHGGWNQRMADFIGHIGTIHRITDRGDIRVQFEGCHNRWTFNPIALNKVISYSVGDIVKISDDKNKVKDLQKSHGEWIDLMHGALGKMGKIVKLYADGDLRVTVDGQTWTFNPQCVSLMPGSATEMNNTMTAHPSREETNVRLGNLLDHNPASSCSQNNISSDDPQASPSSTSAYVSLANKEDLAREAAQGRFEAVKDIVERYPDFVDSKSCGKTALQVAAHQGHTDIVSFLLNSNANINLRDDEGDTALHYSAFGNQASIIELLLKQGSDIDAVNRTRCSALHIAVNKGHLECVRILIKYGCNVNLQDNYGDTALHDAISKTDNLEIIDALVSSPRIDFSLKNRRGFNALHHSALKGNHFAAEKIINKSRQLVDVKKEDGYAALHLSSLNGHYQIVETLIIQGQADINIVNNRKQTPLHLAVSQCHCPIIELLVNLGANVNHINEDNDTALHIAISKSRDLLKSDTIILNSTAITEFLSQLSLIGFGQNINIAIACFLIQDGNADSNLKNRKSKTPIDLLEILKENESDLVSHNFTQLKEFIMNLVENNGIGRNGTNSNGRAVTVSSRYEDVSEDHSQSESDTNPTLIKTNDTLINHLENSVECIICNECVANVIFEPCNHLLLCELCSTRIKKCIKCNKTITSKILTHSDNIVTNNDQEYLNTDITLPKVSVERLKYLESKIAEIEEANSCTICLVPYSNSVLRMAFLCGHSACFNCSQTLKICHMCRKTITKKINLY